MPEVEREIKIKQPILWPGGEYYLLASAVCTALVIFSSTPVSF